MSGVLVLNKLRIMVTGLTAALVVATGGAVITTSVVAAEDEYPPYCSSTIHTDCLQPVKVRFSSACSTGEDPGLLITMNFKNENDTNAPRIITVYKNGVEVFEDNGFVVPSDDWQPLTFGPLDNATWRIVVSWQGNVFGDKEFTLNCQ